MLDFIKNNIGSIIVLLIVLGAVVLAIAKIVSDKKHGKSSCGCNCSGCPSQNMCHKQEINNKK